MLKKLGSNLFRFCAQANLLPTRRFYRRYEHYLLPNIRRLKLTKLYVANAFYQNRIRHKKLAEESLKQLFNDLLDYFDDNVREECGDKVFP